MRQSMYQVCDFYPVASVFLLPLLNTEIIVKYGSV